MTVILFDVWKNSKRCVYKKQNTSFTELFKLLLLPNVSPLQRKGGGTATAKATYITVGVLNSKSDRVGRPKKKKKNQINSEYRRKEIMKLLRSKQFWSLSPTPAVTIWPTVNNLFPKTKCFDVLRGRIRAFGYHKVTRPEIRPEHFLYASVFQLHYCCNCSFPPFPNISSTPATSCSPNNFLLLFEGWVGGWVEWETFVSYSETIINEQLGWSLLFATN